MKKPNFLNIWLNTRIMLIMCVLVLLFSFTTNRNDNRKISKTVIEFMGNDDQFVTSEMVNKLLIEKNGDPSTFRKVNLDLNKLENTLSNSNMIEKSEVFVTVNGVLKALVKQKVPVVRVLNENQSFYIDYQGNKMPLSAIRSARIPLVSGEINGNFKKKNIELFRFIFNDEFLKKNIIGMKIYPNGAVKMLNRNYNYYIDFGRPINIEQKFNNYKAFLQKAVSDSTINKYKKIDLKFTQQVVCTK
jgi:cell division protein FtsQ